MVDQFDPRSPTRDEFSRIFGRDQRTIRAFEKLFELIPSDLISLQQAIEDVLAETNAAMFKADTALQTASILLSGGIRPVSVQTTDYTTSESEIVICTDTLTVNLNNAPDDQESTTVIIQGGIVTINGNGKNIAGLSEIAVQFNNLRIDGSIDCLYVNDTDEWLVV